MNTRDKSQEVRDLVNRNFGKYIVLADDDPRLVQMCNGTPQELLYMTMEWVRSLRTELTNRFGPECAEKLLETILDTEDEVREKAEKMKAEIKAEAKGIPSWLKKLMDIDLDDDEDDDEDDDDAEDEPCDCDDDTDEDGDDADKKAQDEAVSKLLNALGYRYVYSDSHRLYCQK